MVALITAQPDGTMAELQSALPTTVALSTLGRAIDRLRLTVAKKRSTLTNSGALMWPRRDASGRTPCPNTCALKPSRWRP